MKRCDDLLFLSFFLILPVITLTLLQAVLAVVMDEFWKYLCNIVR